MEGPLSLALNLGSTAESVSGLVCGIGFGFALERAGFGRADNLASVFYGRDFRVLRVMFSAIVTAMIGLYFLDLVGRHSLRRKSTLRHQPPQVLLVKRHLDLLEEPRPHLGTLAVTDGLQQQFA